mmetsp:Transcript_10811/g.17079  ORF Transcript_10811/g.17079 Transcript_10811/m.17079 type:complete len:129 (-) Transcript_10811:82-468(-)
MPGVHAELNCEQSKFDTTSRLNELSVSRWTCPVKLLHHLACETLPSEYDRAKSRLKSRIEEMRIAAAIEGACLAPTSAPPAADRVCESTLRSSPSPQPLADLYHPEGSRKRQAGRATAGSQDADTEQD